MFRTRHLRRTLERIARTSPDAEERLAAAAALASGPVMADLEDEANLALGQGPVAAAGDHPVLDWLWAHRAEIMRWVMALLAAWGVPVPPLPVPPTPRRAR